MNVRGSDEKQVITSLFSEKIAIFDQGDKSKYTSVAKEHVIETESHVPSKLGIMMAGLGGNNGSTFVAGIIANKKRI